MQFSDILKLIKPNKKEEIEVKKKIDDILSKIKLKDAKTILGGSGAKGTWLKNTRDIDIFVKFNYNKYKNKSFKLADILEKVLKKKFPRVKRLHGSRDYFQIASKGFTFEIIPVLDIKKSDQAKNITDVSPLHAEFVKRYNLQDQIRLVKAFTMASDCYGAESYIMGFSGYVLEVLTIHYKSFNSLIKNIVNIKPKFVIDVNKYYKNKQEVFKKFNESKLHSPLIVIDPVQKDRNAAAALNYETFYKFQDYCREYLKNPSEKFFFKQELDLEKLKKQSYIISEIIPLKGKEDIIGARLLKIFKYIRSRIIKEGFNLKQSSWIWNKKEKAYFWYKINKKILPKLKIHYGPKLDNEFHIKKFKEKWKYYKIYKSDKNVYIKIPRKFRTIKDYLKNLIKDKEITKKVKKIKIM